MENREAGARLRLYLREHMAKQGIETFMDLASRSGVGRDTLQAWARGRRPTPGAGGKVAEVLGTSYYDLLRAFDGVTEEMDPDVVVAALEWAIKQVRAGQVPAEVRAAVEKAAARRKSPNQNRRRGA